MASRGAEHCLGMASNIKRQRLLHRSRRDMRLGHLIVLAIVGEKITVQREIKDFAELLGHFEVLLEIDTETLEFIGLVTGTDSEHQTTVRKRVGHRNFSGEPSRIVKRQNKNCGTEP